MKKLIYITQLCTLLVAFFFLVLAIDSLFDSKPLLDKVLSFLIAILPALLILMIPIFFRQYYRLSGLLYMGLAIIYFVFYRPYIDISHRWPILVIVVIPLFVIGIFHIFYNQKRLK